SELFGHERGSFTGAVSAKPGLLDLAHRGTIFLDEIADLDLSLQPKLLTVLEEGRFRRLGDVRDRFSDVRLIAATNQPLAERVKTQRFRGDLYYRICGIPLRVPALRERGPDVLMLAEVFVRRFARHLGRGEVHLSDDARTCLSRYAWPGNVRELRNVIERALVLCDHQEIRPGDLRLDPVVPAAPGVAAGMTLAQVERAHIERVLSEEQGNVERAAARLDVPRSTLYNRLRRWASEGSSGPGEGGGS
ncbi:MAG TPA: sigma 54-interacting transcriptional regulator, partial [Myxococcales bacterium]|nr:sigma 54-interacting transcriptional regulator [Myxococcales bacterium]